MSRFAFTHSSTESRRTLDETRATIDAAIVQAGIYSRTSRRPVYVVDTEKGSVGLRGVHRDGEWRWLVTCPKCRGAGKYSAVISPGTSVEKDCMRCHGTKVVEEEKRG